MHGKFAFAVTILVATSTSAFSQQTTQTQLKIEPANRTLTVSAEERVAVDPEIAILHIGFETPPSDAKTAYALGAKTSNDIVSALKQAGVQESSIRSESQSLQSVNSKAHKFKLVQEWTVKTTPSRAAEVLDIAVGAGATDSGEIDWTVQDVHALENQALESASARAKADALVLAKSMNVHLGTLLFVTNHVVSGSGVTFAYANRNYAGPAGLGGGGGATLVIEPHKVSRTATVYAVFAIE